MDDKGKKALLLVGLGVGVSASAVLLYYLFRRDEYERDFRSGIATSRYETLKVNVPRDMVGALIGRQGANIKNLQQKTNTKIHFEDEGPLGEEVEGRTLLIRGSSSDVQEAQMLIHELLHDQPKVLNEEIYIPVRACGRIIGRNGETIRSMCHQSQAKIQVDRGGDERDPDIMKRVTLRGTKQQIETAISLIDEKLAEEEAFRQKVALSAAGRVTRYSAPQKMITLGTEEQNSKSRSKVMREELVTNAKDSYIDVFVSSVCNPGQFWVQLVGTKSVDLDKLVEDMTNFYEVSSNQELHRLDEAVVDEVVAAPFDQDESWYRVRILSVEQDDYSPTKVQVTVYYEDFGETCTFDKSQLCHLLPQWRSMPYQAVECSLAYALGTLPDGGWTQQATDTFKELTYAAQWQVVLVRPVKKPSSNEGTYQVVIMDTKGEKDVNVGQELINRHLALPAMTNGSDDSFT